jgi:hypothetical protein
MADVNRELPAIVTSTAGEDPAVDQFVRNTAAASTAAPLALEALNAAVQSTVTKEYA